MRDKENAIVLDIGCVHAHSLRTLEVNKVGKRLKAPKISVIISTRNRCDYLRRLLDSLLQSTLKDFEIVVVDAGSTDGTKELVEHYSTLYPIKFVVQKALGVYYAWNVGWKNASGRFVVYVDDDVITSPKWLEAILNSFNSSDKVAGVTGPTIIPEERLRNRDFVFFMSGRTLNPIMSLLGKIYIAIVLEGNPYRVGHVCRSGILSPGSNFRDSLSLGTIEVDYLEACNMAYRRSILEDFGGFNDVTYSQEFSENDLCFRFRESGYQLIFNSNAVVFHLVSSTGGSARGDAYRRSLDFIYFYSRNVKLNSIDKALRFSLTVVFWSGYWFYKFLKSKRVAWLAGIAGLIRGILYILCQSQNGARGKSICLAKEQLKVRYSFI
jgi:glycosyltransferase involved in cell wall biosynthesis